MGRQFWDQWEKIGVKCNKWVVISSVIVFKSYVFKCCLKPPLGWVNVTVRINGPWTEDMREENIIFRVLLLKQFISRSIGLPLDLEIGPKPRFWFQVITQDPFSFLLSSDTIGRWGEVKEGKRWRGEVKMKDEENEDSLYFINILSKSLKEVWHV